VKKVLLGVVAVLFIASGVMAQHPQGVITGHILEDGTNNGIWWAEVTATKITGDPYERTVHSGWTGHYGMHHLPAGDYVVTATKSGWSEGVYPDTITVNDDVHDNIDIYLTEIPIDYGSIAGVITDASTSLPIEDATVVVHGSGFWNVHYAHTGADGSYLVDDLEPGDYTVRAHKEDYFPGQYPDPIAIDGNDTTGIDIALAPEVPTGIRGTVTDLGTGNPIEGALVRSYDVNSWHHHRWALTDANGDYEIETRPGEYRVTAVAEGYLLEEYPSNVIVPETGFVEDIDFALTGFSFGSISGTVTDTSGAPLEYVRVIARMYDSWFGRSARTDEFGDYTIENLLPGDYRVHAYKWGFEPEVYPDTVEVPDGGNVVDIDFIMTPPLPDDGVISGTVTDDSTGSPIEGASLIAIGHRHGPWHHFIVRRVFTDANGDYMFDNLPHIPFKIHAHADGYMGEFYDDVHHYWDATPVTPDAADIDIGLEPRDDPGIRSIVGKIVNPYGDMVDGAIVYLMSDGQIVDEVNSDAEGYYGFTNLQPGIYEVSVFTPYGEGSFENPIELILNDYAGADIVVAVTSTDEESNLLPERTALAQNYPNPFNAQTTISIDLPATSNVELSVYNIVGQKITTLLNGEMGAGEHSVIWDGRDNTGHEVASGIYYYRLSADRLSETRRMTLLK
jgi:protocatechuate 3,4-dioxygenase beta subunit